MHSNIFDVINNDSDCELIITCEHASANIPLEYNNLGLSDADFDCHIARDKGAKEITKLIAEKLNCFAILGKYSRLLIDLNRKKDEAELIVETSDGTSIPSNLNLSVEEKLHRINTYYEPYYEAIENQIKKINNNGKKAIIFSIHSYTPQLKGGAYRPWHAGILYNKQTSLANFLLEEINDNNKVVGENVPYDLRKYKTGTVITCGEEKNLDYALIEIRDDEFVDLEKGAKYWADILSEKLSSYLNKAKAA